MKTYEELYKQAQADFAAGNYNPPELNLQGYMDGWDACQRAVNAELSE